MGMASIATSPVSSGWSPESRGQTSHPGAKAALTKPSHTTSPAKIGGFCSSTATTTQISSHDGDSTEASSEILKFNFTLLENLHQEPAQGLLHKVL